MRTLIAVVVIVAGSAYFGCALAPKPSFSVKMTGAAESQMFVCGQLTPGELTCLDLETYVARLKANLEAQKRTDM